jgi:riboflavin kinase / FMN adenylyltransferase
MPGGLERYSVDKAKIAFTINNPGATPTARPSVIAIGVFDGVHIGHQYLLSKVVQRARSLGVRSIALTFDPHPREVLQHSESVQYLATLEQRQELIKALGVDTIAILHFTKDVANESAERFMTEAKKQLGLIELWVGHGFALGRGRHANAPVLKQIGQRLGFSVQTIPPQRKGEIVASSSTIRQLLLAGDVETAATLLGRPYSLQGIVEHGAERGRKLGFPTANIACDPKRVIPADGVYVVTACIDGVCAPSVADIGTRPSFGSNSRGIEVHILDFKSEIYGHDLRVEFLRRLRSDLKFDSVDALREQIQKDIEAARAFHAALASNSERRP